MSDHLDKIRAKIAALKAKTKMAGCTEAEALVAAEMAARLMGEHNLSDADIEMTAARAKERTSRATWRVHISASVAHVTNTAGILLPASEAMEFVGRAPGPDIAAYLYEVLVNAVIREAAQFKKTDTYRRRRTTKTRRAAVADFADGMVIRLRLRLLGLFRDAIDAEAREAALNARALRHRGGGSSMAHTVGKPRFQDANAAGWSAGGKVTLAHGVAGADGRPLALGRLS